jgi:hypothetical protein
MQIINGIIGDRIISFLMLKFNKQHLINTDWGTKTPTGIAASVKRIIQEAHAEACKEQPPAYLVTYIFRKISTGEIFTDYLVFTDPKVDSTPLQQAHEFLAKIKDPGYGGKELVLFSWNICAIVKTSEHYTEHKFME